MRKFSILLSLSINTSICSAQIASLELPNKDDYPYGAATITCVIDAANKYQVPANILLAIASVENGKNGQLVINTNKTYDIGHFQINSMHWDVGGLFYGKGNFTIDDAAKKGCFNAALAAWILRTSIDSSSKKDYWSKVASYHSVTQKYNTRYQEFLKKYAIQWGQWLEHNYAQTKVDFF